MSKLSFDIDAIISGRLRLSAAQALELYQNASMHDLGEWAHAMSQRLHPYDHRTYVIDRNINYTNVCTAKCTFCAFRRDHEDAFGGADRSEEHTSELQSRLHLVCRLLLEKKKYKQVSLQSRVE